MVDLAFVEGFVDVVAGGDEDEGGEDEGEGGEGCGVEDAEEWDMGVGKVHGKDMGIVIECMMMLDSSSGHGVGWRVKSIFGKRG